MLQTLTRTALVCVLALGTTAVVPAKTDNKPAQPPKGGQPPKPGSPGHGSPGRPNRPIGGGWSRYLYTHVHFRVDVAAPGPHVRVFTNQNAAKAFAGRLRYWHFPREVHRTSSGTWVVRFSSNHWHHFRSTRVYGLAVQTATRLRAEGFATRIVRRVY